VANAVDTLVLLLIKVLNSLVFILLVDNLKVPLSFNIKLVAVTEPVKLPASAYTVPLRYNPF